MPPVPQSAARLADASVSALACAFASRDFDESPLARDRRLDIERLCTDGSDSIHIDCSRNEEQGTFDFYILQCASTVASFRRNGALPDTCCLRVDISPRVAVAITAAVDVARLVDDPILVGFRWHPWPPARRQWAIPTAEPRVERQVEVAATCIESAVPAVVAVVRVAVALVQRRSLG